MEFLKLLFAVVILAGALTTILYIWVNGVKGGTNERT